MTTARSMSVTNGKSDDKKTRTNYERKRNICYSHVRREYKRFAMSQLRKNDGLNQIIKQRSLRNCLIAYGRDGRKVKKRYLFHEEHRRT